MKLSTFFKNFSKGFFLRPFIVYFATEVIWGTAGGLFTGNVLSETKLGLIWNSNCILREYCSRAVYFIFFRPCEKKHILWCLDIILQYIGTKEGHLWKTHTISFYMWTRMSSTVKVFFLSFPSKCYRWYSYKYQVSIKHTCNWMAPFLKLHHLKIPKLASIVAYW